MMDMSVRNRLQDRLISWQENRYRKSEERQQHADIRRSRMTCSAELPAFRKTQDWTVGLSSSGRHLVIEERVQKTPLISGEGIRYNVAKILLIAVALFLVALLLADLAGLGNTGRSIVKINSKIQAVESRNDQLKQELALSTGSATIRTEAVKTGLISSNGAQTIRLTAPQGANITLTSASAAAENADLEMRMMSYAGD